MFPVKVLFKKSQPEKKLDKSENDLSYLDLRKLFETSDAEPTELYAGQLESFDDKLIEYFKINSIKEKSLYHIKSRTDIPKSSNHEKELENVLSHKARLKEGRDVKVLYESSHFNLKSQCSNDLAITEKDEVSERCSKESISEYDRNGIVESTIVSEYSNFSGYHTSLSIASRSGDYIRDLLKFEDQERSIFELVDLDECMSVWNYEIPSHKMSLDECLRQDLDNHTKSNLIVCFGNIHFYCQKFIVRIAKCFRKWQQKIYNFESQYKITPVAFSLFYSFVMGNTPKIPSRLLLEVKNLAEILEVPELNTYCMKLLDSDLYQENEAFEVYKAAKAQHLIQIQRLMIQRIFMFFLPLVASKEFIELDVEDVCRLLESDTIGVNSEIEVFYAAILWLNSKWKERNGKILKRVMCCIRYALIPPWFSYMLKKGTGVVEVDRVVEYKSVLKFIENGAALAATISLFFLDQLKFESILMRLRRKIPRQRHWIYDRNCIYHYGAREKVSEAVDYIVFKDYLKVLHMEGKNYWHKFQEGSEEHFMKIFCQKFLDAAWSKVHL